MNESTLQDRRSSVRRRDDDILYWANAAKAFAQFLEHMQDGYKPCRNDVFMILTNMQNGEHPFAHHRSGTLFGESIRTNTIPSWQIISYAVKDGFGLQEEQKTLKATLRYRAQCLMHAMLDFERGHEDLRVLELLGKDKGVTAPCNREEYVCACVFHKNKLAKQGFLAQSRLLLVLPQIISGLQSSVSIRT